MGERSARRQYPRYALQIPFQHRWKTPGPARTGVGWTRDLSEGGACVELAELLQPEMPLSVRLRTDDGPIEVEAEVAWVRKPGVRNGGFLHGVSFIQIAPYQLSALRTLLLSKGLVRPTKVRLPFDVPVTCRFEGEATPPLHGRTRDVSRGGLLLRLPQVVPPETVMEVTVHTTSGPLTVEGSIAWVAPPEGRAPGGPIRHGLRFTRPTWSTSLTFGSLLVDWL